MYTPTCFDISVSLSGSFANFYFVRSRRLFLTYVIIISYVNPLSGSVAFSVLLEGRRRTLLLERCKVPKLFGLYV